MTSASARFPAPHGAGLIEAGSGSGGAFGRPGRWFPAPHGAGLIEAFSRTGHSAATADSFRLLTEPASLKRPRETAGQGPVGSFRLLTEPASLKHYDGCRNDDCRCEFPAPHGAGLIEAEEEVMNKNSIAMGFRLLTEPASLKHVNTPSPLVVQDRVSGSSRSRPH